MERECGSVSDGCGALITCGQCMGREYCKSGVCF